MLSRVLGSGVIQNLGVISYSIYLVHIALLPVRDALAQAFEDRAVPHSWIVAVLCTAALALCVASVCYSLVERPGKRWMIRVLGSTGADALRPGTAR